jgi:hypothetical protein
MRRYILAEIQSPITKHPAISNRNDLLHAGLLRSPYGSGELNLGLGRIHPLPVQRLATGANARRRGFLFAALRAIRPAPSGEARLAFHDGGRSYSGLAAEAFRRS